MPVTVSYTSDPVGLNLGIVGLPNVGKSTLFNALTRNNVLAANYPFATIEPNEGVVPLPDPRLEELAKMFGSEKTVPAPVTFVDIAGIVKGASEGAGLGNKFLANIREADAICQVVRVFTDDDVTHVDGRIDPKSDIEVIETELILADLQTLEKAVPRLEKEARTHKDRRPAYEAAVAAQEILNGGTTLFSAGVDVSLERCRVGVADATGWIMREGGQGSKRAGGAGRVFRPAQVAGGADCRWRGLGRKPARSRPRVPAGARCCADGSSARRSMA